VLPLLNILYPSLANNLGSFPMKFLQYDLPWISLITTMLAGQYLFDQLLNVLVFPVLVIKVTLISLMIVVPPPPPLLQMQMLTMITRPGCAAWYLLNISSKLR
jgi:hypothetical protein